MTNKIDKWTLLSLGLSITALVISTLSFFLPRYDAQMRLSGHLDAIRFFHIGKPNNCTDGSSCETWIGVMKELTNEANKALEAERSNLSGPDYQDAYSVIMGATVEAKEMELVLNNPDLDLPTVNFTNESIEKLREIYSSN